MCHVRKGRHTCILIIAALLWVPGLPSWRYSGHIFSTTVYVRDGTRVKTDSASLNRQMKEVDLLSQNSIPCFRNSSGQVIPMR
ncbi:hypothetical protein B0T19DRAFT_407374 [Cercophora scortea]|uniref:Uncharacterized protein n=1 Tax=Cercophora scortea TaxID=314031 RepID=A0AAE0J2M6_9PEZI|nr:hypothetical protein B0T19DRAFT_407374 [Cercophora scortea]